MNCNGGILILPLNFFCESSSNIRDEFLSKFYIIHLNIFEETVFNDTTYTVCSFCFKKSEEQILKQEINIKFSPSNKTIKTIIDSKSNFRLANEFYEILEKQTKTKITRLIKGDIPNSNIKLRAIDTGSQNGRIKLEIADYYFDNTPNKSERTFCTLKFDFAPTIQQQQFIVKEFNKILEEYRIKYHSLFLTNFRNSTNNYARKRISFDTAYKLVSYIIENNKEMFD